MPKSAPKTRIRVKTEQMLLGKRHKKSRLLQANKSRENISNPNNHVGNANNNVKRGKDHANRSREKANNSREYNKRAS